MEEELQQRLKTVYRRIEKAAIRAEREPEEIKLIPVSKNHGIDKIRFFYDRGITVFGENRVQELLEKEEQIKDRDLEWHFVGHLQRNKVKYLLRMNNCTMIESLDSWRLARTINKRARKNNRVMPVLIEVNVSGDESKYGIPPGETVDFIEKVNELPHLEIRGLMTLAPYLEDPEDTRPYFQQLAGLLAKAREKGYNLTELSMGMTNDFEVAIEEGATIVRIGTALFGKREY